MLIVVIMFHVLCYVFDVVFPKEVLEAGAGRLRGEVQVGATQRDPTPRSQIL